MKRPKGELQTLARIGETLIQLQRTELTLNFCIRHVIPLKGKPSKDVFQPAGRRAPLGKLIAELRRQVDIPDDFTAILREYLDARNTLVHEIEFLPGWTLITTAGQNVATEFLDRLNFLDKEVTNVFYALLEKWRDAQSGHRRSKLPPNAFRMAAKLLGSH